MRRIATFTSALVVVVTLGLPNSAADAASTKRSAQICLGVLRDVGSRLEPWVGGAGKSLAIHVAPWDPEGAALVDPRHTAEVSSGMSASATLRLNCNVSARGTTRQLTAAFRFLIVHEYGHVLQMTHHAPEFDPELEASADCFALIVMRAWGWRLPSRAAAGTHAGCPPSMTRPTQDWMYSIGIPT